MKSGIAHRVPLSKQAIALLLSLDRMAGTDLLFPSPRKDAPLSDMAMSKLMRSLEYKDIGGRNAVPHGLRSTFKDWAQDHTNFQREISEKALAHTVGDEVERAYLRSDAFAKRRRMMQMWADFCSTPSDAKGKKVVPFKSKMA